MLQQINSMKCWIWNCRYENYFPVSAVKMLDSTEQLQQLMSLQSILTRQSFFHVCISPSGEGLVLLQGGREVKLDRETFVFPNWWDSTVKKNMLSLHHSPAEVMGIPALREVLMFLYIWKFLAWKRKQTLFQDVNPHFDLISAISEHESSRWNMLFNMGVCGRLGSRGQRTGWWEEKKICYSFL